MDSGTAGDSSTSTAHYVKGKENKTSSKKKPYVIKDCGDTHSKGKCPAYGQTCPKCNKVGHFACVCRSSSATSASERSKKSTSHHKQPCHKQQSKKGTTSKLHQITDDYSSDESLYSVQSKISRSQYFTEIQVMSPHKTVPIRFQLDSGTSCSTMRLEDYKLLSRSQPPPSSQKLKLYDDSIVRPVAADTFHCQAGGITKRYTLRLWIMFPLLCCQAVQQKQTT